MACNRDIFTFTFYLIPLIVAYNRRNSTINSREQARNTWQAEVCLAYSLTLKTFLRSVGGLFLTTRRYILEDSTFPRIYRVDNTIVIYYAFFIAIICFYVTVLKEESTKGIDIH
jgi:mannose/fructose/N-acetylgalactosamine-specific phosphotransferase system component IIC